MSFTVVPIHGINLDPDVKIPFGKGFVLQAIPEWLATDNGIINNLQFNERTWLREAKNAWVAEYDAEAIAMPDPEWKENTDRTIQDAKLESAIMANLCLWLMEPTTVCFTNAFHAISWNTPGRPEKLPVAQQITPSNRLLCHPKDVHNKISQAKLVKAGILHQTVSTVPRGNAVWVALRATWAALTMNQADLRYALFWIALEALFGTTETSETTYKLALRISFFIAGNVPDTESIFKKVKTCYTMRSKIVHGRSEKYPEIEEVMADTEAIVRTSFRKLLDPPTLLPAFLSKRRNDFLETWILSRSFDAPAWPMPDAPKPKSDGKKKKIQSKRE